MYEHRKFAFAVIVGILFIGLGGDALSAPPSPPSMDGNTIITCGVATTLFNNAVPPNGFMVSSREPFMLNDHGTASSNPEVGFTVNGSPGISTFVTPTEYKPMGVVVVYSACGSGTQYIAARGW
jgi:hypothetical protein